MQIREIDRFRFSTRLLHWVVTVSFLVLGLTGLFLYMPQLQVFAQDGYSRIIHRIAATIFFVSPLIYFLVYPRHTLSFIKVLFTWEKDDIKWFKAAPDYYFGGGAGKMPPQGIIAAGQKLWALSTVLGGAVFVITGILMWVFKGEATGVFLSSVFLHDICFIIGGSFTLVHIYLSTMHPRTKEAMRSMITGKVSVEYAEGHYKKWLSKNGISKQIAGELRDGREKG